MNDKEMTVTQFADFINVQRPSMSHIISGRNNPSLDFVTKVLVAFPEIMSDWLIFGKGEAYRSENRVNENEAGEIPVESKENDLENDLFSFNEPNIEDKNLDNEEVNVNIKERIIEKPNIVSEIIIEENSSEIHVNDENSTIKTKEINNDEKLKLVKVLFFYNNNTFVEYYPQ